jgi:hypothetical protein
MLSDDILLIIFRHCLGATPRFWPMLACVCQRWRRIVFSSPLGLDLRVHCTYGMPVLKTLDCWPVLPIVIRYGGFPNLDPPAPEDHDNIIAALKQSGRIRSINLTVPNSLIEKLSAISEPFSELEELALLSQDNVQRSLPSTFRWGPRLRTLLSTRISFPSFPQLLSSSKDLVYLQLHEIPRDGYFHPEAFAGALSGMTQLRALSLHFLSLPSHRNFLGFPPPPEARIILPALTCLEYRGTSKYLDILVGRIDAPRLMDIDTTFFSQPTMDASQLGQFIDQLEPLKSPREANIETSTHAISITISFTEPSDSHLQLQISCKQLDWQLSSMAQVCQQFSPFLSRVSDLCVNADHPSTEQDDVDSERWMDLVRSFNGVREFSLAGELTAEILCALGPADGGHSTVLPALRMLRVEKHMTANEPSWRAVRSFKTLRWLSGLPVRLSTQGFSCHICLDDFIEQELTYHLMFMHKYRMVCSYCSDFECTPGHNHPFREHIGSKHPEVADPDPSSTLSLPSRVDGFLDSFVYRHCFPRAPGNLSLGHGDGAAQEF